MEGVRCSVSGGTWLLDGACREVQVLTCQRPFREERLGDVVGQMVRDHFDANDM